jgi:hypothetical protein
MCALEFIIVMCNYIVMCKYIKNSNSMLQKIIADHIIKLLLLSHLKALYSAYTGYCTFLFSARGKIVFLCTT